MAGTLRAAYRPDGPDGPPQAARSAQSAPAVSRRLKSFRDRVAAIVERAVSGFPAFRPVITVGQIA